MPKRSPTTRSVTARAPTLEKLCEYFETPHTADQIMQDPLVALAASVSTMTFSDGVRNAEEEAETDVDKTESLYAKALYRMRESKRAPAIPGRQLHDADHVRQRRVDQPVRRGKIRLPHDGRRIPRKNDPKDFEFRVDDKMFSLIRAKDWGRWGEKGVLHGLHHQ